MRSFCGFPVLVIFTGIGKQTRNETTKKPISPITDPPDRSDFNTERLPSPVPTCQHERPENISQNNLPTHRLSVEHRGIIPTEVAPQLPRHPQLEDYHNLEELGHLTVRQLRVLLTLHRVDFKGCIEKSELQEKVYRLWQDSKANKIVPENTPTEQLCKLCMDAPLDCVLLECGHVASCVNCGKQLAECPICRQYVVRVVRIFKA
ncbi:E3 ubiquitin-protein ligase rififylin-like isoform X2 [Euwallacea similis]|uniref:E3 ubiquitin-protein ligase rififylin-like isoform X2 n=1 Tax=Euwallacea similis TaxID=1736056 RepID=UPI00344BADF5